MYAPRRSNCRSGVSGSGIDFCLQARLSGARKYIWCLTFTGWIRFPGGARAREHYTVCEIGNLSTTVFLPFQIWQHFSKISTWSPDTQWGTVTRSEKKITNGENRFRLSDSWPAGRRSSVVGTFPLVSFVLERGVYLLYVCSIISLTGDRMSACDTGCVVHPSCGGFSVHHPAVDAVVRRLSFSRACPRLLVQFAGGQAKVSTWLMRADWQKTVKCLKHHCGLGPSHSITNKHIRPIVHWTKTWFLPWMIFQNETKNPLFRMTIFTLW